MKFRSPKKIGLGKNIKVKLLLAGQNSPTVSLKITEMEESLEDFTGVGLVKERPKTIDKLTYQMALAGVEGACRRVTKRIAATIRLRSRQLPNYRGITANVNETGIEMHLDGPMPNGTAVSLEFDVPEMSEFQIQGVSVWTSEIQLLGKPTFRVGVEFNETDTRVLEAWSAFYRRILQTDGASVMMKSMGDGSESSLRESQRVAEAKESGRHATVEGLDPIKESPPSPAAATPSTPPFQPPASTTPAFQPPPTSAAPQFNPPSFPSSPTGAAPQFNPPSFPSPPFGAAPQFSPPSFPSPPAIPPTAPSFSPPSATNHPVAPSFGAPKPPSFPNPSPPRFGATPGGPPPFGNPPPSNPGFGKPPSPHEAKPLKLGLPQPPEPKKSLSFPPPPSTGTPSFSTGAQSAAPPPLNLPQAGPPSFQPPPLAQPFQPPPPQPTFPPPTTPQSTFQPPPQSPERVTPLKIRAENIMFRCRLGERYQVGARVKVELAVHIQGQERAVAITVSITGVQREADGTYTCVGFIQEDQQRIQILNQLLGG